MLIDKPCLYAFRLARALPSDVLGPVLRVEFFLFARILRLDTIFDHYVQSILFCSFDLSFMT
jgi:hypothetical protein